MYFIENAKDIRGVIQIGANTGQECHQWRNSGIKNQIYFEPVPEAFEQLEKNSPHQGFNVHCYRLAVSDKSGELSFYLGREHGNSSFYDLDPNRPAAHSHNIHSHRINVPTVTLDQFFSEHKEVDLNDYNLLYLDTQGSELDIMKGAIETLKKIDFIATEVSYEIIYQSPLFEEVNSYITAHGFKLLSNKPSPFNPNQGDAYYGKL